MCLYLSIEESVHGNVHTYYVRFNKLSTNKIEHTFTETSNVNRLKLLISIWKESLLQLRILGLSRDMQGHTGKEASIPSESTYVMYHLQICFSAYECACA